jgi:hypothetical protein
MVLLLQTKLYIPPIRPELVSRPRLVERLKEGSHRKLTLVSAPAGFGKTTLVGEWVSGLWNADCRLQTGDDAIRDLQSEIGNRVAWLSLDEGSSWKRPTSPW